MIDPRPAIVEQRLADVGRIVAVTGGKGGIGKSVVASLTALTLARRGRSVGLLDLDLTGPCDHLILGAPVGFPTEEYGIDPTEHGGIRFMSVTHFGGDRPAPLRGSDLTGALLELLAIIRWGRLDTLVLDLPPGLGDLALDAIRLLPRAEYLVVTTPSRVVLETVRRNLTLLAEVDARVAGLVENMVRQEGSSAAETARAGTTDAGRLAADFGLPYLGALPFDETLESAIGDVDRLAGTPLAAALARVTAPLTDG